jgi:large subunit ribosomal protein L18
VASKVEKLKRIKRHRSLRKKVTGTSDRPRLCVFRSARHIYAQVVDDTRRVTIVASSSLDKEMKDHAGYPGNVEAAKKVGEIISKRAQEKGIKQVVFDRGGYLYHGRVKALADGAREAGLDF